MPINKEIGDCFMFLAFLALLSVNGSRAQVLGHSEAYGLISNPFTSISSMGLINHFLYCIGEVDVLNDTRTTDMDAYGQVWATRTDIHVPWSLSFSNSSIKQISVKHSKLGIQQSLMFLLRQDGIHVLPFWNSPRETPDKNHSSWTIPGNVDMITGLSASGGIYGLRGHQICWIPVIKPFTLDRMPLNVTNISQNMTNMTLDNTDFNSRIQDVQGLDSSYKIWLGLDSTTLYFLVRGNGTQVLKSIGMDAQNMKSQVKEEIQLAVDGDVQDFIVHPRTFDYYFVIGNKVLVYGNDKSFKGTIVPSFPIVSSLEIDNDGKKLFVGGKDDQPKGKLDVFDLELAQLSKISFSLKSYRISGILMIFVLYLNIFSFL